MSGLASMSTRPKKSFAGRQPKPVAVKRSPNQQREVTMEQKPGIGRIVWYQAHGSPNGEHKSEPRPAIITRVRIDDLGGRPGPVGSFPELCDLAVFNPTGMFFNACRYDPNAGPGTWRWPERT